MWAKYIIRSKQNGNLINALAIFYICFFQMGREKKKLGSTCQSRVTVLGLSFHGNNDIERPDVRVGNQQYRFVFFSFISLMSVYIM